MKLTTRILRNALVCALSLQVFEPAGIAQVDPWERIKLIEPGKKLAVRLLSGKTVKGKMELWTSDGLSIRQGKEKLRTISKFDVARLALLTGRSRGRKALYAGLIAAGAGAGLMGAACANNGCYAQPAILVPASAGFWGGVAAGIAALFPQHQEVLYTAPSLAASTGESPPATAPAAELPDRAPPE